MDQSRLVADELKTLALNSTETQRCERQFAILRRRAQQLFWALRLFYASLGAFASAALIAVIGSAITSTSLSGAFRATAGIGLLVGAVGVGGLTVGCALMVGEVRLALRQLSEETDAILQTPLRK